MVVKIHMFVQIFIKLRAAVHEFKVIDQRRSQEFDLGGYINVN